MLPALNASHTPSVLANTSCASSACFLHKNAALRASKAWPAMVPTSARACAAGGRSAGERACAAGGRSASSRAAGATPMAGLGAQPHGSATASASQMKRALLRQDCTLAVSDRVIN